MIKHTKTKTRNKEYMYILKPTKNFVLIEAFATHSRVTFGSKTFCRSRSSAETPGWGDIWVCIFFGVCVLQLTALAPTSPYGLVGASAGA